MDFNIMKRRQFLEQGMGPEEALPEFDPNQSSDFTQNYTPSKDPSEMKDDELRQNYLTEQWNKDQKRLDSELGSAKKNSEWAGMADIIGGGLVDFGNSQKKSTILHNRMQDLGKKAEVLDAPQNKWTKIQPVFDRAVDEARQGKKESWDSLKKGIELKEYDKKEQGNDASSPVSKQALLLYQSKLLAKANEADAAGNADSANAIRDMARQAKGLSAADLQGGLGDLKDLDWKDVINNNSADKRLKAQLAADAGKTERMIAADSNKVDRTESNQSREVTFKLAERYSQEPTTKATAETRTALAKAENLVSNPSPNNDIALIFNVMKANDPGSTVREGEFALAARSGSLGDKIQAYVTQAESGQLTPAKRRELLDTVRTQANAQEQRQLQVDGYYENMAGQYKADPKLVIGTKGSASNAEQTQGGAGSQKPTPATVVGDWRNLPPVGGK